MDATVQKHALISYEAGIPCHDRTLEIACDCNEDIDRNDNERERLEPM